jgi:hypothetical protein
LLCDNCSCHYSDAILKELAERGILVVTSPLHTSQIFQAFDGILFGRLRAAKKFLSPDFGAPVQLDHMTRVFRAYEIATTSTIIRASWEKTGFGYIQRGRTSYHSLDKGKIDAIVAFASVWRINYGHPQLSARRRQHKSGWINKNHIRVESWQLSRQHRFAIDAQSFSHIARACVQIDTCLKIEHDKNRYLPIIFLGRYATIAKLDRANMIRR